MPVISVILPVYNGGSYLASSVKSVLSQSLKNFELLILDDCSSDKSWEYLNSLNDPRVVIYKNKENKGLFYNLNYLVKESKSDLIKLWAQDDVMYSDCLESFVTFHQKYPGLGFSYCGRDIIDKNGAVKEINFIDNTPAIIPPELHARIAFFTGSVAGNIANVCVSRKAIDKVGLFNEQMKISADFDMWVRLAREYNTGFIACKLMQLRDHKGQLSRNEEFYINHIKEDLIVYTNLLNYVNPAIKKEGKLLLRNHKLIFYYTLMMKTFFKGSFRSGIEFFKTLRKFDNIWILSLYFLKNRLFLKKKYAKMHLDNSQFIKASSF